MRIQSLSRRIWGSLAWRLLRHLRLLRDNQRHDQVDQHDPAEACEKCQHGQQADDGWVNAEVFAQARAHARDHAVGRASSQLFVVGVHMCTPFVE